jgi:hypothetical protein
MEEALVLPSPVKTSVDLPRGVTTATTTSVWWFFGPTLFGGICGVIYGGAGGASNPAVAALLYGIFFAVLGAAVGLVLWVLAFILRRLGGGP